jgi:hypothetical protein
LTSFRSSTNIPQVNNALLHNLAKWKTNVKLLVQELAKSMSSQYNTARPVKDLDVADLLNVLPCYLICHDIVCIAYVFVKLVLMTAQAGLPLKTQANQRGVWTPREASVMLSDIAKLVILF